MLGLRNYAQRYHGLDFDPPTASWNWKVPSLKIEMGTPAVLPRARDLSVTNGRSRRRLVLPALHAGALGHRVLASVLYAGRWAAALARFALRQTDRQTDRQTVRRARNEWPASQPERTKRAPARIVERHANVSPPARACSTASERPTVSVLQNVVRSWSPQEATSPARKVAVLPAGSCLRDARSYQNSLLAPLARDRGAPHTQLGHPD